MDGDFQNTLSEPGARTVSTQEVRNSTGADRAQWVTAAEAEVQESFRDMGAVTETTAEELEKVGGLRNVLPMTGVWVVKKDGLHKSRGCICGNFQKKSPTEQVWTAQAETGSVMSGLRYSQIRRWKASKLDVKGAFMYAPLEDGVLIVVRPPKLWEDLGVVAPGTLWTVRRAVYGLRSAPRLWGLYRDSKLREVTWKVGKDTYYLEQCKSDNQVWMIRKQNDTTLYGLMLVYVDDFLLLTDDGALKDNFIAELAEI